MNGSVATLKGVSIIFHIDVETVECSERNRRKAFTADTKKKKLIEERIKDSNRLIFEKEKE